MGFMDKAKEAAEKFKDSIYKVMKIIFNLLKFIKRVRQY